MIQGSLSLFIEIVKTLLTKKEDGITVTLKGVFLQSQTLSWQVGNPLASLQPQCFKNWLRVAWCALSVIKTKKFARGKEEIEFLNMMLALYLLHYSTYRGSSGPLREDGKLQKMQIPLIITNCTRGTLSQT